MAQEFERQTDYTVMEGYELPSEGKIYNVKVNPHVELRSMTGKDELKRLSPSTTPLKTLADIIEGCMIEKPAVHVYDMALADYEYLLHKLRIVTYGPDYAISVKCPHCGEFIDAKVSLESLALKDPDFAEIEKLKTFTLPVSNRVITLKFLTPRLLDEIDAKVKEAQRRFKGAGYDFETSIKTISCIESVDGEVKSSQALEDILNSLPAKDLAVILTKIDKLNATFGLDNKLFINCGKCGEEVMTFFRFGPEFFRPAID